MSLVSKTLMVTGFLAASAIGFSQQTLFTYGKYNVSKQSFLQAFNKNNAQALNRQQALNEYKDLYIAYRLKLQQAYDDKLQNNEKYKQELLEYKKQLVESAIVNEINETGIYNEAIERANKDLEIQHIFIATDTGYNAELNINKAYNELKQGAKFNATLQKYCTNASIKASNGYIGYVAVFSLPYEIENIVYGLKINQFSKPYKSKYGWHIFNVINTRKAVGIRKVAQVLVTFPPNASAEQKQKALEKSNDIYSKLTLGKLTIDKAALEYSEDFKSKYRGGELDYIAIAKYSSEFEAKIYSLQKVNEITPVFESSAGYHILSLKEVLQPSNLNFTTPDSATRNFMDYVRSEISKGDRVTYKKNNLLEEWKNKIGYKKGFYDSKKINEFVKNELAQKTNLAAIGLSINTVLLAIGKKDYTLNDFIEFGKQNGGESFKNGYVDYLAEIANYENKIVDEYYKENYFLFSASTAKAYKEFEEANLLFSAMDKYVWTAANNDSVGVKNFYSQNQAKYNWQPSIKGILFTTNSLDNAQKLKEAVAKDVSSWLTTTDNIGIIATADSNRYEIPTMQIVPGEKLQNNSFTTPVKTQEGNYVFYYVGTVQQNQEPKTLEEAKGQVLSAYQEVLEKTWISNLNKKYPVKFNNEVWKTIK